MEKMREIVGYLLGAFLFVVLMPMLMWFVSGCPDVCAQGMSRVLCAILLMLTGLLLSIWTIIYMKQQGKGNPMDAFGYEVAPRTKHLMTEGPYRLNRNPMLTGTLVYLTGIAVELWSWQALCVLAVFFVVMLLQVLSEERRLHRDFGEEYDNYCRRTRRF